MAGFAFPSSPTTAQRILAAGSSALVQLARTRANYQLFWRDPINIAAQLETNAAAVFSADAALVAFLGPQLQAAGAPAGLVAAATAGVPAQWSVSHNPDRTVTITQTNQAASGGSSNSSNVAGA